MAQSPKGGLSAPTPGSRTLFLPAPGTEGILITQRNGRDAAEERREFGSATAAISWCLESRVNLVFYFDSIPSQN